MFSGYGILNGHRKTHFQMYNNLYAMKKHFSFPCFRFFSVNARLWKFILDNAFNRIEMNERIDRWNDECCLCFKQNLQINVWRQNSSSSAKKQQQKSH